MKSLESKVNAPSAVETKKSAIETQGKNKEAQKSPEQLKRYLDGVLASQKKIMGEIAAMEKSGNASLDQENALAELRDELVNMMNRAGELTAMLQPAEEPVEELDSSLLEEEEAEPSIVVDESIYEEGASTIKEKIDAAYKQHDARMGEIAVWGLNVIKPDPMPNATQADRDRAIAEEKKRFGEQLLPLQRQLSEAEERQPTPSAEAIVTPQTESTETKQEATEQAPMEQVAPPKAETQPVSHGEEIDARIELGSVEAEEQAYRQLTRIDVKKNPKFALDPSQYPLLAKKNFGLDGWTYADLDPSSRNMKERNGQEKTLKDKIAQLKKDRSGATGVFGWVKRRSLDKEIAQTEDRLKEVQEELSYIQQAQIAMITEPKSVEYTQKKLKLQAKLRDNVVPISTARRFRPRRIKAPIPANDNATPTTSREAA